MPLHWQSEYTRLYPRDDLAGKVVERMDFENALFIMFTDKTYLFAYPLGDEDGVEISLEHPIDADRARIYRLISEAEWRRAAAAEDAAYQARAEHVDRATYERLKAKFEKGA